MKSIVSMGLGALLCSGICLAGQPVPTGQQQKPTPTQQQKPTPTQQQKPTPIPQGQQAEQEPGSQQEQGAQQGETQKPVSAEERSLLIKLHVGNISEIKSSLVALTRPVDEKVREYAWSLIEGHFNSEKALYEIAVDLEVDLTDQASMDEAKPLFEEQKTLMTALEEASDEAFQQTYVDQMKASHEAMDKTLGASVEFVHSEISDFVTKTQAEIKTHLDAIETLTAAP